MKKIVLAIKENWKDPVWSKVIATVIITIGSLIITSLIAFFKALFYKLSLSVSFENIFIHFNNELSIRIWLIGVFLLLYLILIFTPLINLINNIIFKIKNPRREKNIQDEPDLKLVSETSTSLFTHRMAEAFPGVRYITWFNNAKEATNRLEILLQKPLLFQPATNEASSDPIWWIRGYYNSSIIKFKKIGRKKALMNHDELKIKRIAVNRDNAYYKDFVYVEIEAEKQTGLYHFTKDDIKEHIESYGTINEEYGLYKNRIGWKKLINRDEYDDGATVVKGKVKNDLNMELRRRYLSDYNFIIIAKESPYNSRKFENNSEKYLDGILKGDVNPDDFFKFLKEFKRHER